MTTIHQKLRLWLLGLMAVLLPAIDARAGWIEDKPDGSTVIHVSVEQLPDATKTDAMSRADVATVNIFRKQFPGIFAQKYRDLYKAHPEIYGSHNWDRVSVELHQFSGLNVAGLETDLLAIATGTPPDVMHVVFHDSDHYIQSGFLYPLDDPKDGYFTSMTKEELDHRIHPKAWPVIKRRGPDGQTHVWTMPYGGMLGTVLLYRKDLFDKHQLAYPDANWTWDDMLSACRKITDPANDIYGLIGGGGKSESWFWFNYLWSAGGQVMTEDPQTHKWHCVFDSREAAIALDFYEQFNNEKWIDSQGKVRRGYTIRTNFGVDEWNKGRVGMYVTYIDQDLFINLNPDLTGMAPLPIGAGGHRGGEVNYTMMGLSSQIRERTIRDAAWEFIRFFDCDQAQAARTKILVESGVGQFLNPELLRRYGYPEIERLAPKGWSEIFDISINTGQPEPYGPNASYIYKIASYPIQEVENLYLNDKLPQDREKRLDVIQGILHKGVVRANEEMFGIISPEDRIKRDRTAAAVLVLLASLFVWWLWRKFRAARNAPADPFPSRKWSWQKYLTVLVLLAPAVLTIVMWQYLPLARGSAMAFQDYQLMGNSHRTGLKNFGDLLYDANWWLSVWNAIRYCLLIMGLTFLPPILLAVLLQEVPRGSVLFRVIYYLPAVLSGLVTVILWRLFFNPNEYGLLNLIVMHIPAIGFFAVGLLLLFIAVVFALRLAHHENRLASLAFVAVGIIVFITAVSWALPILWQQNESPLAALRHFPLRLFQFYPEPFRWLTDPSTAMLACVIPLVWAGVGPGCLIYLAALKGVPDDFYEAADLDGATFIDKIMFVVFPILRPLILINFIGVFIGSFFGAEGNILAMTGGDADTDVAGLHIFFKAFTNLQFGIATAMAWVLASMLIGLTAYQLRIIRGLEFRAPAAKR